MKQEELPVRAFRRSILHTVAENNVCIIIGETGSGKTTQIAQVTQHGICCQSHL